jgi:glucosamine--fructose-6-phosphate aminotransferase (isomerizing)
MNNATVKEIREQADAWIAVLEDLPKTFNAVFDFIRQLDLAELVFIGCGTSYYLAQCAASVYTGITGERARAVTASDVFLYPKSIFPRNAKFLGIPISRSGSTTETIWASKYIQNEMGIETLALSCNPQSELVKINSRHLVSEAAAEKSVVMTKSFTSMLLMIQLLAAAKCGDEKYRDQLIKLPAAGKRIIRDYEATAKLIAENRDINYFIFLGQGPYYGLANESMLKMKEMSLSISEAYHSMEFRHGPISIVNQNTIVVFLMSDSGRDHEIRMLKDVKKLGAKAFVICERGTPEIESAADYLVELNSGLSDYARLILYMPIMQLLGYHRAMSKGLDPDNPKNLTQVVVLE